MTTLYVQQTSSAGIDPPRAWLAKGVADTKRWDVLTEADIVLCCTADDICAPANWWGRVRPDRKRFVEDMVFTATRTRLESLYGRVAARVPETAAALISGALVAATLRKAHADSSNIDIVVLVVGSPLGQPGYARTIAVYAFNRHGLINLEIIESARDIDSLAVSIGSTSGLTHKFLSDDHDRAVIDGLVTGPFPGVSMARVLVAANDEVVSSTAALRRFAYVTSFRKQRSSKHTRLITAGVLACIAAAAAGYGAWLTHQSQALEIEQARLAAARSAIVDELDGWIGERPVAYARALSLDLPAALDRAATLAASNLGARIAMTVVNGAIRYDIIEERDIPVTPNAGGNGQSGVILYRTPEEFIAALRRPAPSDMSAGNTSVSRDGQRFLRSYLDDKVSARFPDSVVPR